MLGNGLGRGFTGYLSRFFYIAIQSSLHPCLTSNSLLCQIFISVKELRYVKAGSGSWSEKRVKCKCQEKG